MSIVYGLPITDDPRPGSLFGGGDLFHACKNGGTQVILRIPNMLRMAHDVPLAKVEAFYQAIAEIKPFEKHAKDILKYTFKNDKTKPDESKQIITSMLGTESIIMWCNQHLLFPHLLNLCDKEKQEILCIAGMVSQYRTQQFMGACHSKNWDHKTDSAKIEELKELMRLDAEMIGDFLPNFVC